MQVPRQTRVSDVNWLGHSFLLMTLWLLRFSLPQVALGAKPQLLKLQNY
jgi:hypothetical protein